MYNIDGVYLNEETCKIEIIDTLADHEKSSVFWLRYTNWLGEKVETDKKIWIQHFLVDKDTGIGKSDFGFKIRIIEKPSVALSEWMKQDQTVELWETRPKIIEKKLEDGSDVKEAQIDSNGKPVIDTRLRGILKVNLSDWIYKAELPKPEDY